MASYSKLRKSLGRVKCKLIDELPYLWAMRMTPEIREHYRQLLPSLKPLNEGPNETFEIHMLCGHRDADMGIWASWSLMRFLDGSARLYIHSDGTLTECDVERWTSIVRPLTVVPRMESDEIVDEALSGRTRHLYKWRLSNWASAQLVDVHYFGRSKSILLMDSDVLVFERPDAVLDVLSALPPRFGWCTDLLDAYSAPCETLREITGVLPVRKLCAGFLVTPRLSNEDFLQLDQWMSALEKDPRVEVGHFWSCQTYYALIAGATPGSLPFPHRYQNTKASTKREQVLRHYVGIPRVRFRYFTEGLKRIVSEQNDLNS